MDVLIAIVAAVAPFAFGAVWYTALSQPCPSPGWPFQALPKSGRRRAGRPLCHRACRHGAGGRNDAAPSGYLWGGRVSGHTMGRDELCLCDAQTGADGYRRGELHRWLLDHGRGAERVRYLSVWRSSPALFVSRLVYRCPTRQDVGATKILRRCCSWLPKGTRYPPCSKRPLHRPECGPGSAVPSRGQRHLQHRQSRCDRCKSCPPRGAGW